MGYLFNIIATVASDGHVILTDADQKRLMQYRGSTLQIALAANAEESETRLAARKQIREIQAAFKSYRWKLGTPEASEDLLAERREEARLEER